MTQANDIDHVEALSPMDLSTEAALELEELKQQQRADAPALEALFKVLQRPWGASVDRDGGGISMLADARSYSVLRRVIEPYRPKKVPVGSRELEQLISDYLKELLIGVADHDPKIINEAREFCLSLTRNLVSKNLQEIYHKKEVADNRYMRDVSV